MKAKDFEQRFDEGVDLTASLDLSKARRAIRIISGRKATRHARVSKVSNLVLLADKVAKAFPTGEPVNEALLSLLKFTEQTARITGRAKRITPKRFAV